LGTKRLKGRRRNQQDKDRPRCLLCCVVLFVCLLVGSCLERARALTPNRRTDGRTDAPTHTPFVENPFPFHSPKPSCHPSPLPSPPPREEGWDKAAGRFCLCVVGSLVVCLCGCRVCLFVCLSSKFSAFWRNFCVAFVCVFAPPVSFVCLFVCLLVWFRAKIAIRAVIMTHQHGVFA